MAQPAFQDFRDTPTFQNSTFEEKSELVKRYWQDSANNDPQQLLPEEALKLDQQAKDLQLPPSFHEQQYQDSIRALTAEEKMKDASPIQKRFLQQELQDSTLGRIVRQNVRDGAMIEEEGVAFAKEKQGTSAESLKKTASLFDEKVNEQMQPAYNALTRLATEGDVFGNLGVTGKVNNAISNFLPGGQDQPINTAKKEYEGLKTRMADNFGLKSEEVDDMIKHRMDLQEDPVSRDVTGQVHFKADLLDQGPEAVTRAIGEAKLPDSVKATYTPEKVKERLDIFKQAVVERVKKNSPDLYKWIGLGETDSSVDQEYAKIRNALNDSKTGQLTEGLLGGFESLAEKAERAAGALHEGFSLTTWLPEGTLGPQYVSPLSERAALVANRVKMRSDLTTLSHDILNDKVEIMGTDAATVGQGIYSGIESAGLMYATAGLGELVMPASKIAGLAGKTKWLAEGAKAAADIAPMATIYGVDDGTQIYEQARKLGKSEGESLMLAAKSAVAETGITMLASMFHLGGTETTLASLANKEVREQVKRTMLQSAAKFGGTVGIGVVGEQFEENFITFTKELTVQSKLNPQWTTNDMDKAIRDTAVATLFASGPLSTLHATQEAISNTFSKTTDELKKDADRIAIKTASQENVPEGTTQARPFPSSGTVTLAEIEQERKAQLELTEDPDEREGLETNSPEELAKAWGVDLVVDEKPSDAQQTPLPSIDAQQTPLPIAPEAPQTDLGLPAEPNPPLPPEAPAADTVVGEVAVSEAEINDNQQPTESPQPRVPVSAVPGPVLAADPASEAPAPPTPAAVDESDAGKTLTSEAEELLANGGFPAFISKNLEKIAAENGVEITGSMKPEDVIAALRAKQGTTSTPKITPEQVKAAAPIPNPLLDAPLEEIAKAAFENPNDVNAALLVFAAMGTRPSSLPESGTETKVDENGNLMLFQKESSSDLKQDDTDKTKGYYTPKAHKGAANVGKAMVRLLQGNADESTGIHEALHAVEDFLVEIGEAEKAKALDDWARENVGNDWVARREFVARGFERYVINGVKTGIKSVDAAFARIADIMLSIYRSVNNSAIAIDVPPHIEKIFNELLSRGKAQEEVGKAPDVLPVDVTTPLPAPKKKPVPARKQKPDLVGARRAMNEETRARLGIPDSKLKVESISDQEAIDAALMDIVENENYEKATSEQQKILPEPPKVGKALVDHITFNPELAPNKYDTALLVHEAIQAEKAVDTARNKLEKMADPQATDFEALETARTYLTDVLDLLQFRGSQAGLALQAYKLVTDRQFNREIMLSDYSKWQNTGKEKKDWTPVDPEKVKEIEKLAEEAKAKFAEAERLEKIYRDGIAAQEAAQLLALQKKTAKTRKTPERRPMTERVVERAKSARDRLAGKFGRREVLEQRGEEPSAQSKHHAELEAKHSAGTITSAETAEAERLVEERARSAGYDVSPMYHGTQDERFNEFSHKKKGSGTEATDATLGFFFTDDVDFASFFQYPWEVTDPYAKNPSFKAGYAPRPGIKKVFLRLDNPKVLKGSLQTQKNDKYTLAVTKSADRLKAEGYDGIVAKVKSFRGVTYTEKIVFDPSQIKSADPFTGVPLNQRFNEDSPSILHQDDYNEPEFSSEDIQDFADIMGEYMLQGDTAEVAFDKLTAEFDIAHFAKDQIIQAAKDSLQKVAAGSRAKTPQELASLVDPDKGINPRMIYNMAGGLIEQGFEGTAILDKIVELLKPSMPELTRDDVVLAYTGYGKAKFPNPDTKLNRENRNLELIGKQLEVAETGVLPEKSGPQRDPTTPKVRALRDAFHVVVRKLGLKSASDKKQMRGSLDAIKTRFKNDIADIKLAIAENRKLAAKVKNKTEYDTELKDLKAEKNRQVKIYNATFGIDSKKLSQEQRLASAERALDRSIAREEEMALKGILDRPKTTPLAATPAMKLKQARLKKLTDARRAEKKRLCQEAKEILNPTKTAAQRATENLEKGLQKQIERFEYFLKNGKMPDSTKEKTTYERETFPVELFKTKEDLQEAIAWLKADAKKLSLSQKLKKNRTVAQLEKLRDALEKQINSRNWDKPASNKGAVDPREQSLKETLKILRSIKEQTQKLDPTWVYNQEQKLEARLIAAAKTEREKWQGKLDREEFFDEAKIKREPSAALNKVRHETGQVKQRWLKMKADRLLANKNKLEKAAYWSLATLDLRKIISLGFDTTLGRQGLWGLFTRPIRTSRNITRALTMLTAEREQATWDKLHDPARTPVANLYKINKNWKLFGPDESGKLRGKEDVPDPEMLEAITKWKIGGVRILPANVLAQGILILERYNRAFNNLLAVDLLTDLAQISPSESPTKAEAIIATNATMVAIGRGSFASTRMDAGAGLLNYLFISTRYMLGRAQMATGQPLWVSRGAGYKGTLKMRRRVAKELYLKMLVSTSTIMGVLGMIFFGDDEEKWWAYISPLSNKFGVITINGIEYKPLAGMLPYIAILSKMARGYKVKDGKVVPLRGEGSGYFKGSIEDEWQQFQDNRRNINYSLAMEIAAGKHYGGEDVTTWSAASKFVSNINIVNDMEILKHKQSSPLQKAFTIGMVHAGFSANVERELKAAKAKSKLTTPKLKRPSLNRPR